MPTTDIAINRINELVSSGEASPDLIGLVHKLPNDIKLKCIEAILLYAIVNNLSDMIAFFLNDGIADVLYLSSNKLLWTKVCEEDVPDIVDLFISNQSNFSEGQYDLMFKIALEFQASYAINSLQGIISENTQVDCILSVGNNMNAEMIKGFMTYPSILANQSREWINGWGNLAYYDSSKHTNEQRQYRRDQLRLWISHQKESTLLDLWNIVIVKGLTWIAYILKEEGCTPPVVSEMMANMFIEDGSLEMFSFSNAENVLNNGEELQDALSRLVQMKDQRAFILYLMKNALPACKNYFCRLIGMPYDRLEIRKISRNFDHHVNMRIHPDELANYTQAIYVGLMVDKFGIELVAEDACYEWQVDQLLLLGFGPLELMGMIKSSDLKSFIIMKL